MPALTSNSLTIAPALLREATTLVDRANLVTWCQTQFEADRPGYSGGQKAQFGWRPLLIGLALLAITEQPMMLRGLVRTLNALTPAQKGRSDCPSEVTERMVSRRFAHFTDLADTSEYSTLNRKRKAAMTDGEWDEHVAKRQAAMIMLTDRILSASIPAQDQGSGSYAIDATGVASWSSQRRKWKNKDLATDPDAAWRAHDSVKEPSATKDGKGTQFRGKAWYGYWLHAAVRIPEMTAHKDGTFTYTETGCYIDHMSMTSASSDMAVDAANLITSMVTHKDADAARDGHIPAPLGDLTVDRAYSQGYERFLEPARALGFAPQFDLRSDQRGVGGSVKGMLILDGQPFSPMTPAHLHTITPPRFPGANRQEIADYQQKIADRAKYAIRLRGTQPNGSMDWSCPAARDFGALRCGNKPESVLLAATIPTMPAGNVGTPLPAICSQQKVRTDAEDIPLWQPHMYGSEAWWKSMARRSRVEGAFGNMKNDAAQNITRGCIRVMGLAKNAVMATFLAAAVNLRITRMAAQNAGSSKTPARKRGPRARTTRIQAERARRLAQGANAAVLAGGQPEPPF